MGGQVVGNMIEKWRNSFVGALPICGVMGDNELFDFFQDQYLLAETLVGNVPIVPTPADYFTNPLMGWQVTRTLLGPSFPRTLTAKGALFKQIIENLSGGDRPVFDEGWIGPAGGDFTFNRGSAVAGPGRENVDTTYQFRGRGHCEFTTAEVSTAFGDLVNWVVKGVKPGGDDILDPATVAAPDFGCKFTPVTHALVPACPLVPGP